MNEPLDIDIDFCVITELKASTITEFKQRFTNGKLYLYCSAGSMNLLQGQGFGVRHYTNNGRANQYEDKDSIWNIVKWLPSDSIVIIGEDDKKTGMLKGLVKKTIEVYQAS